MHYAVFMSELEILPCPLIDSKEALQCLHRGVSTDQQDALVATLEQLRGQDATALGGLLIARQQNKIVAATWIQRASGNTAILWPPDFGSPAATALMRAVDSILKQWRVPLAQMVIGTQAVIAPELLALAGFHRLVELDYLALENPRPDEHCLANKLLFEPYAADQPGRLHSVLMETYKGTLDCPQLNDLRDPADVIASYRAQGDYKGENWFLVQWDCRDVGVLILAEHDGGRVVELVYMGVIPKARGRSFGDEILRHAISHAAVGNAERLVLAVDTQNDPAKAMYLRAGFSLWDTRTVYARIAGR